MPQQKLQHQGIDRGSSATAAALDVLQDEEAEQARVSAASKRSPSAHAVAQDRASHARASLKGALGDLMVKGSKLPAQFAERDVRTLKGALADLEIQGDRGVHKGDGTGETHGEPGGTITLYG